MIRENNDAKNYLAPIIIGIVLLIAAVLALNFFVLIPQKSEILKQKNTGIISIKERPIKKLNTEIFNNTKFSELNPLNTADNNIKSIKTGKRNIFNDN